MDRKHSAPISATCIAHPVQGLVCAHGYKDPGIHTLPVETVFVSIGALQTSVTFTLLDSSDHAPLVLLDGQPLSEEWYTRMTGFVSRLLQSIEASGSYRVDIQQNFQSGIGIGSSAAVYAALTKSIVHAVKRELPMRELSALARLGSYSAAAAIVGNVNVIRTAEAHCDNIAETICPRELFPYCLLVLPVPGEKRSAEIHEDILLSPFYERWLRQAKILSKDVLSMISRRRFHELGPKVEGYIYTNFAAICTGPRNLLTWNPGTLRRLAFLRELRDGLSVPFFISMNSGPALFVYVRPEERDVLWTSLAQANIDCIPSDVGGPASLLSSAAVAEPM